MTGTSNREIMFYLTSGLPHTVEVIRMGWKRISRHSISEGSNFIKNKEQR